jgi:ribosomal protein S18 acetylase RimI-like enzyme
MTIIYEHPRSSDLAELMKIEQAGFTPEEAATTAAMRDRIEYINDTFIVARKSGQVVGFIVGPAIEPRYLTDDLFTETKPNRKSDKYQSVLSLAVAPAYQNQGIASHLLDELKVVAKEQKRRAITLTCLSNLISFYTENGFITAGVSKSEHAGETWYDMLFAL